MTTYKPTPKSLKGGTELYKLQSHKGRAPEGIKDKQRKIPI